MGLIQLIPKYKFIFFKMKYFIFYKIKSSTRIGIKNYLIIKIKKIKLKELNFDLIIKQKIIIKSLII